MDKFSDADLKKIVDEVVTSLMRELPSTTPAPAQESKPILDNSPLSMKNTVAIGADHGGYPLKESLIPFLEEKGYTVVDCGTNTTDAVDYPDIAQAVAEKVQLGTTWRGIMIDGAGIGSCMAANKVTGVRAAMCYDYATAFNSRAHNDANLLTLGAGLIGPNLAKQIIITFLETEFAGGRHAGRVDKIMEIEK